MIYARSEGEPIKNGLNFYPKSDLYNKGFVIRILDFLFWCRYSVNLKKMMWRISHKKVNSK